MSQGWTAVNVPGEEETVFNEEVRVETPGGASYKQDMGEDRGALDTYEVSFLVIS